MNPHNTIKASPIVAANSLRALIEWRVIYSERAWFLAVAPTSSLPEDRTSRHGRHKPRIRLAKGCEGNQGDRLSEPIRHKAPDRNEKQGKENVKLLLDRQGPGVQERLAGIWGCKIV